MYRDKVQQILMILSGLSPLEALAILRQCARMVRRTEEERPPRHAVICSRR